MRALTGLGTGVLFGAGLAASGMTNTAKVIGFLDIGGRWDPDLLWVMASAVIVTLLGFRFVLKQAKPLFSEAFSSPSKLSIDVRLVTGAALFGVGWGLYGYCPGPAIAALVYRSPVTLLFVIAMLSGMWLASKLDGYKA
jgi:hypothetical protein